MVMYAHIKIHQIPLTDYLVMAPDGCDEQTEWQNDMEKLPYLP